MADPVVLVDLDGVVWRGDEPIAGAAAGVATLRAAGARVAFFTNNSWSLLEEHVARLQAMGIATDPADILTSSQAAAGLLEPGETALVLGGPGLAQALLARRVRVVMSGSLTAGFEARAAAGEGLQEAVSRVAEIVPPEVSAVVAGIDPELDYARLALAAAAVRSGARFVATNTDATYPTARGLVPGAGAVIAALRVASGSEPVVAGKPHEASAALARERLGPVSVVVGDRPDTDGALAGRLGARFALVLSGVTPPGHGRLEPAPDLEASDLGAIAPSLLGTLP